MHAVHGSHFPHNGGRDAVLFRVQCFRSFVGHNFQVIFVQFVDWSCRVRCKNLIFPKLLQGSRYDIGACDVVENFRFVEMLRRLHGGDDW